MSDLCQPSRQNIRSRILLLNWQRLENQRAAGKEFLVVVLFSFHLPVLESSVPYGTKYPHSYTPKFSCVQGPLRLEKALLKNAVFMQGKVIKWGKKWKFVTWLSAESVSWW